MEKPEFFDTPGYGPRKREGLHDAQAVRIGDRNAMSGQGGVDDDLRVPATIEDQVALAFRNFERPLATAGAGRKDVVHINSYHVGGFPPVVNETMTRLVRHAMPNHAPIRTELGVEALGPPGMRVEIRVTAILTDAPD